MTCKLAPPGQSYCSAPRVTCSAADRWRQPMNTIKLTLIAAGLLASLPVLAQTAGGTQNTGPQGTGNFVAGKPEGSGNFVAGKPEGNGNLVAGKPEGNGNFVGGKPKDPAK